MSKDIVEHSKQMVRRFIAGRDGSEYDAVIHWLITLAKAIGSPAHVVYDNEMIRVFPDSRKDDVVKAHEQRLMKRRNEVPGRKHFPRTINNSFV